MTRRLLIPSLILITGCTVGPDFKKPVVTTPESFTSEKTAALEIQGEASPDWFAGLGDPLLDRLVTDALRANHDLKIAASRVREARALRSAAAGRLLPDVGTSVQGGRGRLSGNAPGNGQLSQAGVLDLTNTLYEAGFDAAWEIDLWGGRRRGIESASARVAASIEQRRDVQVAVIAEVVRNYVELRGLQQRREAVRRNVRIQQDSLTLVEARVRHGLAASLDASRARALLESSRSRLPGLRVAERAAGFRLAVLTGRLPGELLDELDAQRPVLSIPADVPVGLPSQLLTRRPDLRRAEAELHAATAEIGVATAELFPRFSLTGGGGYQSVSTGSLTRSASRVWSLGGLVRFPWFQGGRLRANIEAVKARHEATLIRYEQSVLLALEEVETSIVRFGELQQERMRLNEATEASREALRQARTLYDNGLINYLDVLEAERSLTEIEDRLAASETGVGTAWVALYKALGGGAELTAGS
ncbi:hypothetical protein ABI59_18070 [Acidobacteria bacterium Mor1]|nr:hypothetical protein ABI59_18070 [Acidobacteria bacterium Mor1]